jgi:hypothetical protein
MTRAPFIRRVLALAAILAVAIVVPQPDRAEPQTTSGRPAGFPDVVGALRTTPGCLGVETAQTASGKRVIFAWFEDKKSLVDWYHSDVHQKAMKTVFPKQAFDRQPLPDLDDASGPILAIVSVKPAETPTPDATAIASIGIELYGPLPGGIAVGGRFAPAALKVRGLREMDLGTALGQAR